MMAPDRNPTIVITGAGSGVGRAIAQRLGEQLGKPVVIENVGGASTMIGAERVAKSTPLRPTASNILSAERPSGLGAAASDFLVNWAMMLRRLIQPWNMPSRKRVDCWDSKSGCSARAGAMPPD